MRELSPEGLPPKAAEGQGECQFKFESKILAQFDESYLSQLEKLMRFPGVDALPVTFRAQNQAGKNRRQMMEGKGTLTGLTLKDKLEGQFIEIKVMARYDPALLAGLGGFFGKPLGFQVTSPQPDLDFKDGEGNTVLDIEREIESRR